MPSRVDTHPTRASRHVVRGFARNVHTHNCNFTPQNHPINGSCSHYTYYVRMNC
jgi:hypothetical protein